MVAGRIFFLRSSAAIWWEQSERQKHFIGLFYYIKRDRPPEILDGPLVVPLVADDDQTHDAATVYWF
jgi:hypothetical protein